ncbi:type II secretion system protein GspD [Aeoliella mucimassa]|uniref:Type IV pilus biogenesis and competence protein PilQ n=1 Tax=Aeoliella mucimassa TaxID=2527972 RepID=A0A518AJ54_9BACT|nr:type II secretion system protein GspD [Aeoliella mucimassa]QDU54768.1 Type IV pilus biogenesis and competence protein PilQ precursor [Aeoliella mucimassa]
MKINQPISSLATGLVLLLVATSSMLHAQTIGGSQPTTRLDSQQYPLSLVNPAAQGMPSETLPEPVPADEEEVLIPVRSGVLPDTIEVENEEGMIHLVVRDAPLRQVLALLAESQKLNLVFASVSDTTVTVSLDQVPLSTALDAILSSCGHTWTRRGNIIHVTQVSEGLAVGPAAQGRMLEVFTLDYAAAADVDLAIKGLLSPVGKSWVTQSSSSDNRKTLESITVEDLPEYIDRIAAYITHIDQAPQQVLVEVQILEVVLSDERSHGINFHQLTDLSGTGITFATTGYDPGSPTTVTPGPAQTFFFSATGGDLSGLVELLQETNDAKTLASPKLLAVNGQESHIQIGEKLPYRLTTTTQTSTQESVQFLDVGVVLRLTPWISRDGRVLLRIAPKVSHGSVNPNTELPEEATTEVETDALLLDGQGVVIGGLIRENDDVVQSKIPVLGDIPYAGVLFQKRKDVRKRTEIIIALMPHLVPYNCDKQYQNDAEVQRARDPLVVGPLCRYPRPYEAKLPDITDEAFKRFDTRCGGMKGATNTPVLDGASCSDTLTIRRIPGPNQMESQIQPCDAEIRIAQPTEPAPFPRR